MDVFLYPEIIAAFQLRIVVFPLSPSHRTIRAAIWTRMRTPAVSAPMLSLTMNPRK